jgi:MFS family permease
LLSDAWIGTTLACQYAILSLLAPVYGHYADQQERKRPHWGRAKVLIWGIAIGTVFFCMHGIHRLMPTGGGTKQQQHSVLVSGGETSTTYSIAYHLIVQCGYAVCFSIMFPVLDGLAVDYLQQQLDGDSMDYGKERLFGAIGWGVTNLCLGPLIDRFGLVVYYLFAIATAIYSIVALVLYAQALAVSSSSSCLIPAPPEEDSKTINDDDNENQKEFQRQHQQSTLALTRVVFGSIYGAAFLTCYFLLNTGFSVVENMVFLFFEFLGGSNTLCAITVALTVIFEIPVFSLAPRILRKHGVGSMLMLANVAFWIRIVGYTLIPQGHSSWVLLLEPLHGFTYAGAQTAAVEYVNQRVPRGSQASGQGIVNFVRGLANVLGLWAGGVLQDSFGPRIMYRVFITAVTFGMAVFGTVQCTTANSSPDERSNGGEDGTNQHRRQNYEAIPDVLQEQEV